MHIKTLASAVFLHSISCFIDVTGAPVEASNTTSPGHSGSTITTSSAPFCSCMHGGNSTISNPNSTINSSTNGTSSDPQFVIYSDIWVDEALPDPSKVEGYTVYALSFLLASGPADQAQNWASLDTATRKKLKGAYSAAEIKLIVSAFGETETPSTSGSDPTKVALDMAKWVKQYGLDGIDVDYEDFKAMNQGDGKAEEWITTFTKVLKELPKGEYILTHAPIAPWFSPGISKGGAYLTVHKNVGDLIDWYNMQFYNQEDYTDCTTLLTKSKATFKASVFEIAASGIDLNKIVIGKPAIAKDASDGYMAPEELEKCLAHAKEKGRSAGAMVWEYPHADSKWIKRARGDVFPLN